MKERNMLNEIYTVPEGISYNVMTQEANIRIFEGKLTLDDRFELPYRLNFSKGMSSVIDNLDNSSFNPLSAF